MAIEKTYLLGKNITLGCGFDLQAKAPLDSRQVVPEYDGLQALIDGNAAYEGMIVYDEGTKKTYQAQLVDGVLAFREFGINEAELKALIASETTAAMEFKGAATALPENPSKGDFYKVTTSFDVAEGETAKVGDSIVYDGEQWFIIPSGDDMDDTWRPVTDVDNDSTLTFAAGDKLDVAVAANGTVTYSHEAIDAPTATPVGEDEQTRTYIASIETDGFGHITGYKTATEKVEDTNTTYEFEGLTKGEDEEAPSNVYFQVTSNEEGATAEVIYIDAYTRNEADGKFVEKVEGKQLSTEDFTTALLNKLNGIAEGANKYEHAPHTAYAEGFYKVTVDAEGHVSNAVAVTKEDIVALGIPGQDTTYEKATANADGLMSKEHFAKVEGIAEGATKVENVGDGKIKINDQEVTVYAHPDKHGIDDVTGLQDALDGKVVSVTAGDASVTVGGTATAPTVAAKISAAEGNALTLATDGLQVIIPESTKVEASETNGNIKVDGQEVTVYEHPEKHAIADVDGLQDALDGKATAAQGAKADNAIQSVVSSNGNDCSMDVEVSAVTMENTVYIYGATVKDGTIVTDKIADSAVTNDKLFGGITNDKLFGGITKDKLDTDLQSEIDGKAEKATTLAGYGITDAYTTTQVDEAIEGAKTDASNQDVVVLAEAQKHTDDKVKALADTVYTQAQVDALLSAAQTWGEF